MSNQPQWKLVYSSDCEALHIDETGIYRPELTVVSDLGEADGYLEGVFLIHRFPLDRCEYDDLNDILSNNSYHPSMPAWFAGPADRWSKRGDLQEVADCVGMRKEDLITLLCSEDPVNLAAGYRELVSYYGAETFNPDGEKFRTEAEALEALI